MTVKSVVFHEPAVAGAGRIVSVFTAAADSIGAHTTRRGLAWLEVDHAEAQAPLAVLKSRFVDLSGPSPVLADCKPLAAVWTPETATFTGLPQPCTVRILGEAHEVTDGVADLSDLPAGDYAVTVSAPGWLAQTYQVTR